MKIRTVKKRTMKKDCTEIKANIIQKQIILYYCTYEIISFYQSRLLSQHCE